jgi:hypothetical protein
MAKIDIYGGNFMDSAGNVLAGGKLILRLNNAAVVMNTAQIASAQPILITLDNTGNAPNTPLWFNDQLSPSGTAYIADLFSASGAKCWSTSQLWSFTGTGTINLDTMVPTLASELVFYVPTEIGPTGPTGATGTSTLAGLTDVVLTSPQDGDMLQYNAAASKWKNVDLSTVLTCTGAYLSADGSCTVVTFRPVLGRWTVD